jgi:hypothetical protein
MQTRIHLATEREEELKTSMSLAGSFLSVRIKIMHFQTKKEALYLLAPE